MRAVCFDLDGTLFDDAQYVRAGFERVAAYLRETHGVETYDELVWEYYGLGNYHTVLDRVLERHGLPESEIPALLDRYHAHDTPLETFPEVDAVLGTLEERYKLGVITDGRNGRSKIRHLGLEGYFDSICVSTEHGFSKHDPDPFEFVLGELSVVGDEAAYVGDNPQLDFYWPKRLGLWTIRVRRSTTLFGSTDDEERRAEFVVPDLTSLPAIVAALGTDSPGAD